jgi:hypothetical protein
MYEGRRQQQLKHLLSRDQGLLVSCQSGRMGAKGGDSPDVVSVRKKHWAHLGCGPAHEQNMIAGCC